MICQHNYKYEPRFLLSFAMHTKLICLGCINSLLTENIEIDFNAAVYQKNYFMNEKFVK